MGGIFSVSQTKGFVHIQLFTVLYSYFCEPTFIVFVHLMYFWLLVGQMWGEYRRYIYGNCSFFSSQIYISYICRPIYVSGLFACRLEYLFCCLSHLYIFIISIEMHYIFITFWSYFKDFFRWIHLYNFLIALSEYDSGGGHFLDFRLALRSIFITSIDTIFITFWSYFEDIIQVDTFV